MANRELLLHPVRLRIVQAFLGEPGRTAREIAAQVPDIPPATLYRQLATLVEGGVLAVVAERRVRGAVERVYTLQPGSIEVSTDDLRDATPEDHIRYFATFLSGLLGDFTRYLRHGAGDFQADGVGYRAYTAYLSDDEFRQLLERIGQLLSRAGGRPPAPGRRRRLIARIAMPLEERSQEDSGAGRTDS